MVPDPLLDNPTTQPLPDEPANKKEKLASLEESLKSAKKAASDCILKSAWTFTIPGVALSVPISVYLKSYSPLVFTAVSASGFDYINALRQCTDNVNEVKRIQKEIAILKLTGSPHEEYLPKS